MGLSGSVRYGLWMHIISALFQDAPHPILALFDKHADDIFYYCYRRLGERKKALTLTERVFSTALNRFNSNDIVALQDLYGIVDEFANKLSWRPAATLPLSFSSERV